MFVLPPLGQTREDEVQVQPGHTVEPRLRKVRDRDTVGLDFGHDAREVVIEFPENIHGVGGVSRSDANLPTVGSEVEESPVAGHSRLAVPMHCSEDLEQQARSAKDQRLQVGQKASHG